jgi:hypothetical protein
MRGGKQTGYKEAGMSTRSGVANKTALARARERRRVLDRDRDAQDQRIEEATAKTLMALEGLAEADDARTAASVIVGAALRELLAADVSPERAAALLEVDVVEVRRLSKVATAERSAGDKRGDPALGQKPAPRTLPEPSSGADATRRAG